MAERFRPEKVSDTPAMIVSGFRPEKPAAGIDPDVFERLMLLEMWIQHVPVRVRTKVSNP